MISHIVHQTVRIECRNKYAMYFKNIVRRKLTRQHKQFATWSDRYLSSKRLNISRVGLTRLSSNITYVGAIFCDVTLSTRLLSFQIAFVIARCCLCRATWPIHVMRHDLRRATWHMSTSTLSSYSMLSDISSSDIIRCHPQALSNNVLSSTAEKSFSAVEIGSVVEDRGDRMS